MEQEAQLQTSGQDRALETIQNPYYGVEDAGIETNQVGTVQVTENFYYE